MREGRTKKWSKGRRQEMEKLNVIPAYGSFVLNIKPLLFCSKHKFIFNFLAEFDFITNYLKTVMWNFLSEILQLSSNHFFFSLIQLFMKDDTDLSPSKRIFSLQTGDRWRAVSNFYSLRWTILYLVISKGSECIHPEINSFMLWKNERCWPETDLIGYGITIH